jgi:hypothetical protein
MPALLLGARTVKPQRQCGDEMALERVFHVFTLSPVLLVILPIEMVRPGAAPATSVEPRFRTTRRPGGSSASEAGDDRAAIQRCAARVSRR